MYMDICNHACPSSTSGVSSWYYKRKFKQWWSLTFPPISTKRILTRWIIMRKKKNMSQHMSLVWFKVFNATSNNISVISWRSVLLVEETGVPENHRLVTSHWQIVNPTTKMYYAITTTTAPLLNGAALIQTKGTFEQLYVKSKNWHSIVLDIVKCYTQ